MRDILQNQDLMKNIAINPRTLAIISFILALPMAALYPIVILEVGPLHGFFKSLFTVNGHRPPAPDAIDIIGVIAMLLLPVAFIVNLVPIVRNVRAGNSLVAIPINVLLAVAILVLIAMTWGALLVDQIPCFMGVPNCD
jgi:hypothetical protein